MFVHATRVHIDAVFVLHRGPSAAEEYDCAVRMIHAGAKLEAGDRMQLAAIRSEIIAVASAKIAMALSLWRSAFSQMRTRSGT